MGTSLRKKKKMPKNFMFKMCFRPHRTQKNIFTKKKIFFHPLGGLDLEFFRCSEKKFVLVKLCLKCVSGPVEPKKYIHQKQNFFSPLRGFGLKIFSMFRKKICFGEIMFKMCFRPHRTQKIYSPKTKFFSPLRGFGLKIFSMFR